MGYVQASTIRKISTWLAATMMIFQAVFKIIDLGAEEDNFRSVITCFYFCFIGVILVLVEMEWGRVCQWFVFLNFGLGKAFLLTFMASTMVSFESTSFLDIILAVLLLICLIFNLYLHFKFRELEDERVKKIIIKIKE